MSLDVSYNPSDSAVPNVVTAVHEVDIPSGSPNTINNPNTSQVNGIVIPGSCKYDGVSSIVPFTAGDQTAWNAEQAANVLAAQRAAAQADIISSQDLGKLERAAVDVIEGVFNNQVFGWMTSMLAWKNGADAAVANATTLANLKTAWAAITPPNVVPASLTLAQAKTAISNEIGAGTEGD